MEKFPKFLIVNDTLYFMKVVYHHEIAKYVLDLSSLEEQRKHTKGGGWFRYDDETKTFIFKDESYDFGKAKLEDIKSCFERGRVYNSHYEHREVIGVYNFAYDTGTELITLSTIEK